MVGSPPAPLCARRGAAVRRCEHAEQTRGIWGGLYVERWTVGTHQVYGRTQASASLKKLLPPNAILTLGPTGFSTQLHFLGAST